MKRKRELYINDISNIDNKKLRITFIRSGLWLIVLGILCFILAISMTNIKDSLLITLTTLGVTTFLAFLNIFILLQNRKYDDIQKLNEIQYELSLCDSYKLEEDFIPCIAKKVKSSKRIDVLINELLISLNAK